MVAGAIQATAAFDCGRVETTINPATISYFREIIDRPPTIHIDWKTYGSDIAYHWMMCSVHCPDGVYLRIVVSA
jgi:hypothetical protein